MAYPSVSVIVTTYNWPQALDRVLASLNAQKFNQLEVIIADDGSIDETAKLIEAWGQTFRFPLTHCWQEDQGFRAAMIRNRAIALAKHDYIIFIDGDCIVRPDFVLNHAKLAELNWFVAGNRILLTKPLTQKIFNDSLNVHEWSLSQWLLRRSIGECNRLISFF